jgi:hypothetical protein
MTQDRSQNHGPSGRGARSLLRQDRSGGQVSSAVDEDDVAEPPGTEVRDVGAGPADRSVRVTQWRVYCRRLRRGGRTRLANGGRGEHPRKLASDGADDGLAFVRNAASATPAVLEVNA